MDIYHLSPWCVSTLPEKNVNQSKVINIDSSIVVDAEKILTDFDCGGCIDWTIFDWMKSNM